VHRMRQAAAVRVRGRSRGRGGAASAAAALTAAAAATQSNACLPAPDALLPLAAEAFSASIRAESSAGVQGALEMLGHRTLNQRTRRSLQSCDAEPQYMRGEGVIGGEGEGVEGGGGGWREWRGEGGGRGEMVQFLHVVP